MLNVPNEMIVKRAKIEKLAAVLKKAYVDSLLTNKFYEWSIDDVVCLWNYNTGPALLVVVTLTGRSPKIARPENIKSVDMDGFTRMVQKVSGQAIQLVSRHTLDQIEEQYNIMNDLWERFASKTFKRHDGFFFKVFFINVINDHRADVGYRITINAIKTTPTDESISLSDIYGYIEATYHVRPIIG